MERERVWVAAMLNREGRWSHWETGGPVPGYQCFEMPRRLLRGLWRNELRRVIERNG